MADQSFPQGYKTSAEFAQGLQYVRWLANGRSEHGNALLVVAIGVNSIAISRDLDLRPEDGIALLELEADTIAQLLEELKARKKTHGAMARPDR
jgi:hypothetical protein